MNPLYEHLNDELERQEDTWSTRTSPDLQLSALPASNHDEEVNELVAVARRIQLAAAVQVDPDFAETLEHRMLVHHAMQRLQRAQRSRWSRFSPRSLVRAHPVFSVALSCCLLVVLLGMGVLLASAQVSDPNNPLYGLNQWEQQVQVSLSGSPAARAGLDLQFAAERLNTLMDLANNSDAVSYEQQLEELDQQIGNAVQSINQVPAGVQRDQLTSRLVTLEAQARHVLRGLLLRLSLLQQLATTDALADLGDSVPSLKSVQLILPVHPGGQATIIINGSGLESGAHLVIDGQVVKASGSLQNEVYTFLVNWNSKQPAHSVGILNPDGTLAQTTIIGVSGSGGNGNGGNGNGNGCRNRNGNGKGNGCGNGNPNGNGSGGGNGNPNGNGNGNGNPPGNGNGHGHGNGGGGHGNGGSNGNGHHG